MAPFTPKAVVTFEDIPISKTAKRLIVVKNPQPNEIKVFNEYTAHSKFQITYNILPVLGSSYEIT